MSEGRRDDRPDGDEHGSVDEGHRGRAFPHCLGSRSGRQEHDDDEQERHDTFDDEGGQALLPCRCLGTVEYAGEGDGQADNRSRLTQARRRIVAGDDLFLVVVRREPVDDRLEDDD